MQRKHRRNDCNALTVFKPAHTKSKGIPNAVKEASPTNFIAMTETNAVCQTGRKLDIGMHKLVLALIHEDGEGHQVNWDN
ncbi:hypothetical protein CSKR_101161, partial [Clonorchis sinensis]